MGELKYNFGSTNATTPNAYTGMSIPYMSDYLQTLVKAPQNIPFSGMPSLSSLSPQQLAIASGMPLAPTIGGSTDGYNWSGITNPTESFSGNPTGLTLGAGAGGGLPKIAMTDKINTGVGLFNAALGAISASKALKLGKENLAFQRDSFNKNYEAMKGTTNAEMEDRQARRVRYDAQNGLNNHLSVAEYMAKFGVK